MEASRPLPDQISDNEAPEFQLCMSIRDTTSSKQGNAATDITY